MKSTTTYTKDGVINIKELIFVKLGGSIITEKSKARTARYDTIARLAHELHEAKTQKNLKIIVGHGGGSYPHQSATQYQTHRGIINEKSHKGIAIVQNDASTLNRIIVESFLKAGENAISVQPSACAITENSTITEWYTEPIKLMLKNNLLPIPYGDAVMDTKKGCSIISTEQILSYLAKPLGAKKIILVGKVDGVLDSENNLIPKITKENFLQVKPLLRGSDSSDVTGGMLHKVEQMLNLAQSGITSEIINGETPGNLKKALLGTKIKNTVIE